MEDMQIYIGLAAIFGLFMAWGIGANDVANVMATSVGSKALTIKQAIIVAAIFEFTGAVLAGGEVTSTIRKGIIDATSVSVTPELMIYGMLAALAAAGCWLWIASRKGWPVSTTHSIVGAIVGFVAGAIAGAGGRHIIGWPDFKFSGHGPSTAELLFLSVTALIGAIVGGVCASIAGTRYIVRRRNRADRAQNKD